MRAEMHPGALTVAVAGAPLEEPSGASLCTHRSVAIGTKSRRIRDGLAAVSGNRLYRSAAHGIA